MSIRIVPYTAEHEAAVREFNRRLIVDAPIDDLQFPETPDPGWLPGMELFVALEDGAVRGGYILRRQRFFLAGKTVPVAHYRLPLSEGVVNRAYATLGLRLMRDALAREPLLYALGMGGWQHPLPQMLKRLGWRMCAVPFHFKVVHPFRFLREIDALRTTPLRRLILDAAAYSGIGWLGLKMMGHARRVPKIRGDQNTPGAAASFLGWADEIFDQSRSDYTLLAARDSGTLDQLYPPGDPRFLRVRAAGGWAVLLDTAMEGHKQFGNIRVGTIVDCLAPIDDAGTVIRAATRTLEQRGVDLIVSNQLHAAWCGALAGADFRRGPSNFLFAASPALAALIPEAEDGDLHINRGDGDGPIHL
jgi:hypothetical protein